MHIQGCRQRLLLSRLIGGFGILSYRVKTVIYRTLHSDSPSLRDTVKPTRFFDTRSSFHIDDYM
jgi:hypothetical protein